MSEAWEGRGGDLLTDVCVLQDANGVFPFRPAAGREGSVFQCCADIEADCLIRTYQSFLSSKLKLKVEAGPRELGKRKPTHAGSADVAFLERCCAGRAYFSNCGVLADSTFRPWMRKRRFFLFELGE